jgi:mycothiol synthase
MSIEGADILLCPADCREDALALVLCDLAPSQRREIASKLSHTEGSGEATSEPLYIAQREGRLCGAAWGQRQTGNVALFWPPQLVPGEPEQTAYQLADVTLRSLETSSVEMTQAFLSAPDIGMIKLLKNFAFRHLADLLYMTCEADRFSVAAPDSDLEFAPYEATRRGELLRLTERTYEDTLDCAALNGVRDIDNVIAGYQATGTFRSENWLFVRHAGEDVGLLLLTDHPPAHHWELMYMGLVPEVRGRGWGRQITRYAQWLARGAHVERIVVAVDAANEPAVTTYRSTGFELWDRRAVYLRILTKSHA